MALYHVMNPEATNGEALYALIVTNGRNKARRRFAEIHGVPAKTLQVQAMSTSGEYVLSTNFTDPEPLDDSAPWHEQLDILAEGEAAQHE